MSINSMRKSNWLYNVILCLLILLIAVSLIRILVTYTSLFGRVEYSPRPWFGDVYCSIKKGEEYSDDILSIQISINPTYVNKSIYLLIGAHNETLFIYDLRPFHNVTDEYFQKRYIYLEFPTEYLGLKRSVYSETCISMIFMWKNGTIDITPCIYPDIES